MRPLQAYVGLQLVFRGTVTNFGCNKRTKRETVLLIDVEGVEFSEIQLSHVWVESDEISSEVYKRGDIIQFKAIIKPYRKGKQGARLDFGFRNVKEVERIGKNKKLNPIIPLSPSNKIAVTSIMSKDSYIPTKKNAK